MKVRIILENGTEVIGESLEQVKDVLCELVFNTSMIGYEEVLTDASYKNQGVVMTYPSIGNYGITEDSKDSEIYLSCIIVNEFARIGSNFRKKQDIIPFLKERKINAVHGIDTRMLARILRDSGSMIALITNEEYSKEEVIEKIQKYKNEKVKNNITLEKEEVIGNGSINVALIDFGSKDEIIKSLKQRDCKITVYPSNCKTLEYKKYDMIVISEGPGNPEEYIEEAKMIKDIYNSGCSVFAVGLGHQLIAIAAGANTLKLKQGHRGANIPIKDIENEKTYSVAQNHGYIVIEGTVEKFADVIYRNVNDKSVEGLKYKGKNIVTLQFNPDSSSDTEFIIDNFIGGLKNA